MDNARQFQDDNKLNTITNFMLTIPQETENETNTFKNCQHHFLHISSIGGKPTQASLYIWLCFTFCLAQILERATGQPGNKQKPSW